MAINMNNAKSAIANKAVSLWETNSRGFRATQKVRTIGWSLFRGLLLLGICFIIIYPIITMISYAFRASTDLTDPSIVWVPKHYTFENIVDAFRALRYPSSLLNTLKIGFVSACLQVASCAIVGYGFARFNFKGKGMLFALVILTIMVPPQVVYTPTYLFYKDLTILNTPFVMWLPAALGVGMRAGLFIYIFRQFYRNLPKELEDAAYIDGCGFIRTFLRVIIPNAKSSFLTVFLISTVWYWNDYYFTTMYFNTSSMKTVSSAMAEFKSLLGALSPQHNAMVLDAYATSGYVQAACLLVILPVLVMYIFLQKHFTQGLERSGLTGM